MKKIAITLGDVNGISPEITIKALNNLDLSPENVVIIGAKSVFEFYKNNFSLTLKKDYEIIDIPFDVSDIKLGQETKEAGELAFSALKTAIDKANKGEVNAIVTAPLSKHAIHMAGHNFSGQTEILEKYLNGGKQKAQMLFVSDKINVLLLTRHVALSQAIKMIKKDFIVQNVSELSKSLSKQLNIASPKIILCALNPHASENSLFGDEEEKEIIPAIKELNQKGYIVDGAYPSDTLFFDVISGKRKCDCVVALYHDQGLIPLKLLGMDKLVNTTIGLKVLRTSPAHGVAYDIAGKNIANPQSMVSAIQLAYITTNIFSVQKIAPYV